MRVRLPCSWKDSLNQTALGWEPLTMLSNPWTTWTTVGMSAISLSGGACSLVSNAMTCCSGTRFRTAFSRGRFQHVEDLLLLDIAHQVRLVGMAALAQHPTVKLDAYRVFQGGNALV